MRDFDSVQGPDPMRLNMLLHALFRIYEQSFLHAPQVGIDDACFASSELTKSDLWSYPGVQRWWLASGNLFESEFIRHVESVIAFHSQNRPASSPVVPDVRPAPI